MEHANWLGFNSGIWQDEINVRDFIQTNYTPYLGNFEFLTKATARTTAISVCGLVMALPKRI